MPVPTSVTFQLGSEAEAEAKIGKFCEAGGRVAQKPPTAADQQFAKAFAAQTLKHVLDDLDARKAAEALTPNTIS